MPEPLNTIPANTHVTINDVIANEDFGETDESVSRRLNDLGFYPGASLVILSKGLLGNGPYAVRVNHAAQFSLRLSEAKKILCTITDATLSDA